MNDLLERPLSVTFVLIALNVAVSLVGFYALSRDRYRHHFVFVPSRPTEHLTGTVLSHFAHGDFGHLFLNMLALFFFGPDVERALGAVQFAILYAVSGVIATLTIYVLRRKNRRYAALGASGCIAGVLFAAVVIAPTATIFLFVIPLPAPVFAILYLVFSSIHMGGRDGIAHEAHLGGAVAGFAMAAVLYEPHLEPLIGAVRALVG